MTCPRCGQGLPAGARFCVNCGQSFAPAPTAQGVPQAAVAATAPAGWSGVYVPPPTKRWPWVVGALLAAVLAALGLRAVGLLRVGSSSPNAVMQEGAGSGPPLLQKPGEGPPPLLQMPDNAPPPLLQMPSTVPPPVLGDSAQKITMPKEDLDWLKWLEKIEKEKQALTSKEQTQLTTLMASLQGASGLTPQGVRDLADPDSPNNNAPAMVDAMTITKEMEEAWTKLKNRFDSYPPPPDCVPIGAAYDGGLQGMSDNVQKLEDIMSGIAGMSEPGQAEGADAVSGAKDIGQKHPHDVDSEFTATDQLVQDICDKFETRKWFSIDAHGGAGNVFSLPGGL